MEFNKSVYEKESRQCQFTNTAVRWMTGDRSYLVKSQRCMS